MTTKKYTAAELATILDAHKRWLMGDKDGSRANLTGADLTRAYLTGANLAGADLTGAYLADAYLADANLTGAYLTDADLTGAYLTGADLTGAYLPPTSIVPESGAFTAFKKLRGGVVATLEIPADAERVGGLAGRKCRASKAKVVALSEGDVGYSTYANDFAYRVGEVVTPDRFDPDIRVECSSGIHFFITRKEAEDYIG